MQLWQTFWRDPAGDVVENLGVLVTVTIGLLALAGGLYWLLVLHADAELQWVDGLIKGGP